MNNAELWQAVLGEIELSISKANFSTWFKNTHIISNEDGKIIIGVPNGFAKEWLENKYNTYIFKALRNFQDNVREISCVIYSSEQNQEAKKIDSIGIGSYKNAAVIQENAHKKLEENKSIENQADMLVKNITQDDIFSNENT